jgi:biotin synthase-related radical SAM superfamily protein
MCVFRLLIFFILPFTIASTVQAQLQQKLLQNKRAVTGEMAVCTIKVDNMRKKGRKTVTTGSKSYQSTPNQLGSFDMVTNIQPRQKVPIEIYYPEGRAGEKVIIEVQDGGSLDNNKRVSILSLTNLNKISFGFQTASDPGIYRITLRKGSDLKVVQLWVGDQP